MISTITALKSSSMEIDRKRPRMMRTGSDWLAPAMATTLSRLMIKSAMAIRVMALNSEVGDNQRERHAHHDRHSATPEHRLAPLPGRQEVGSQPDDDRVVARKHQVKEDNLEDRTQIIKRHGQYLSSRKGMAFVDPLRPG